MNDDRKHRSLYGDFFATIDASLTVGGHLRDDPEVLANRLVHLVVLHGLLPETSQENP